MSTDLTSTQVSYIYTTVFLGKRLTNRTQILACNITSRSSIIARLSVSNKTTAQI
jgi:hypothetical protein